MSEDEDFEPDNFTPEEMFDLQERFHDVFSNEPLHAGDFDMENMKIATEHPKGMTPEERARWEKLRKKGKKDSTVQETREYSDLLSLRLTEVMRLIPVPQCCEASRNFPTITFSVEYGDNISSDEGRGKWHVTRSTPLEEYYRDRDDVGWYSRIPEPKFCPYCGTPLPEMRRKDPPPDTICRITDGGYYCARCKDRLDGCLCDPIAFAFEPVP